MGAETPNYAENPQTEPVVQFTIEKNFLAHIEDELAARGVNSELSKKNAFVLSNFLTSRLNVADVQPGDQFVISATEAIRFDRNGKEVSRAALGPRMQQFFGEVLVLEETATRDLDDLKADIESVDDGPIPPSTSISTVFEAGKKWSGLEGDWNSNLYARSTLVFLIETHPDILNAEEIELTALDTIGSAATNIKIASAISAMPVESQKLLFTILGDPRKREKMESKFDYFRGSEARRIEARYRGLLGDSAQHVGFNPETKPLLSKARLQRQMLQEKQDLLRLEEVEPRTIDLLTGIAEDLALLERDLPGGYLTFVNKRGHDEQIDLQPGKIILTAGLEDRKGTNSTHEHGLAFDFKTLGYSDAILRVRAIYFKELAQASEVALGRLAAEGSAGAAAVLQFEKNLTAQSSAEARMTDTHGLIQYIDNREHGSGTHDHINLSRALMEPDISTKVDDRLFKQVLEESRKDARIAVETYLKTRGIQVASLES